MNFKIKKNYIMVFAFVVILLVFVMKINNLNNFKQEEKIKIQEANALIQKGEYDLAEKKLEQIEKNKKIFNRLDKSDKFDLYNYLGIINTFQRETVSAILMYEEAEKYVSKENKYKVEINSSIAYRHMGEYIKSTESLIKIINSFNKNKTENARIKTYALLNLAEIYFQVGSMNEYNLILSKIEPFIDYLPKSHKDDLLIMYYSDLIIKELNKNNFSKIDFYFKKIDKLEKENTVIRYTESKMLKTRAYALYFKKTRDIDKTIEYFEQLEEYGKKEGDIYTCQFSIKERIEIYKKLKQHKEYDKLVQKFYKNELDTSKINNKQYEFHLNNKIKEEEDISIMRSTSMLIIFSNLFLIGIIVLVYKKMKKSKYESMKDPLCNVYNRRYLELCKKNVKNKDLPISILMIDVDYFKLYNDNYGHQYGDEVLKSIAEVLKSSCRKSDMIFRYGGEEFCIVLKNTIKKESMFFAERILKNISDKKIKHEYSKAGSYISLSIGISTIYSNKDIRNAINLADKALYISKENGRGKCTHIEDI
ncbi:diguanylate cyclase [Paraclostridium dentum]|uniref:diguanylate cyclase n=1 Tax=Paraclostridium dentum TaxID=2662455 RepID=UPI003B002C40